MKKIFPEQVLYWAGMSDEYIMRLKHILFDHPELIEATNKIGDNALTLAARMNNEKICKYLINDTDINIQHVNEFGNIIMNALHNRHVDLAWYFIENTSISLHTVNSFGNNLYFFAARYGLDELISHFLDSDVDINILNHHGNNCLFPLIEYYNDHQNGWCFELIQSNLSTDKLFAKNNDGLSIIDFIDYIIANADEGIAKRVREEQLLPLKERLLNRQKEESESLSVSLS